MFHVVHDGLGHLDKILFVSQIVYPPAHCRQCALRLEDLFSDVKPPEDAGIHPSTTTKTGVKLGMFLDLKTTHS